MASWASFLTSTAGASGALAGLIFVAVSLNLVKVLEIKVLPDRALEAVCLLVAVLVLSLLLLAPGQSLTTNGWELLILGTLLWLGITKLHTRITQNVRDTHRKKSQYLIGISQIAVLCYIVSGILLLWIGQGGMYVLVAAMLLSIVKAILDAWVLLMEVNR